MATKVSVAPEVKQALEGVTGVKIDKVITLADILAVVALCTKVLKMPDVKALIAEALGHVYKKPSNGVEIKKAAKKHINPMIEQMNKQLCDCSLA